MFEPTWQRPRSRTTCDLQYFGYIKSSNVLHLLRCPPSVSHSSLAQSDMLKRSIQLITIHQFRSLRHSVVSGQSASPRSLVAVDECPIPAFVASTARTLSLQEDILSDCAKSDNDFFSLICRLGRQNSVMCQTSSQPNNPTAWDRPGELEDKALVEASLNSAHHRASFLAASSQHSGDWLFALPIASCGLRLDDEAVRVAVGLRLGLDLCVPHHCHCGFFC